MCMKSLVHAALAAIVLLSGVAASAAGADTPAPAAKTPAQVAAMLGLKSGEVTPSPAPGLYEVHQGVNFGYVTTDGRFLIQGDMMNLRTGVNVTDAQRNAYRLALLKGFSDKEFLIFAPTPPIKTKWTVTAFTDVDCPYCRKLQSEVREFNKRGIALRYAFFPRSGPHTPSFFKAESVWCSSDPHSAFVEVMHDSDIPTNTACENPVAAEYRLGQRLGLQGTPMLILPNGTKVDGYVPPDELVKLLATHDAQPVAGSASATR
jgi:Protein-disulfide isomerase